jgi:hypothetical protein
MQPSQVEPSTEAPSRSSLATLEAMALLARQTASVIHVVVPRERGVVESARRLAQHADLKVCVDMLPRTVRVRYDGQLKPVR